MAHEFGNDSGLQPIELDSSNAPHCVLSELDAIVCGCAKYYQVLSSKDRDPTWLIRAAGWPDFEYQVVDMQQNGSTVRVQVADRFGVMLYLATVHEGQKHLRRKAYDECLDTVEETDGGVFDILEEVTALSTTSEPCRLSRTGTTMFFKMRTGALGSCKAL